MLPPSRVRYRLRSAGLAVHRVLAVLRAVLHQLEPVGVVAPVLASDVIAVLALLAGQGDLRADCGGWRGCAPRVVGKALPGRPRRRLPGAVLQHADGPRAGVRRVVAVTGFEPVTRRL